MDFYLKEYRTHALRLFLPLFLLLYIMPLVFWYRLTEYSSRTVGEFIDFFGRRGAVIYAAVLLAAVITDFVMKYRRFKRQLSEFHFTGDVLMTLKIPAYRIHLTDEGLISSAGTAVRYANIDRVIIEGSETEALTVYHMYIYRREGRRLIIPVGMGRSIPMSFDRLLESYNTEVIRQKRPLLGGGGKYREK